MSIYKWKWVAAMDLTVRQIICLSASTPGNNIDFDDLPREEIVFVYETGRDLQRFITHDGIERKLPMSYWVWAYTKEES